MTGEVLSCWLIPGAPTPLANSPTEEVKPGHGTRLVFQLPLTSIPGLCLHSTSVGGDGSVSEGFTGWTVHLLDVRSLAVVSPPLPPSPGMVVFMVLLQNRNYCRST